jgi:hypothetical protein
MVGQHHVQLVAKLTSYGVSRGEVFGGAGRGALGDERVDPGAVCLVDVVDSGAGRGLLSREGDQVEPEERASRGENSAEVVAGERSHRRFESS